MKAGQREVEVNRGQTGVTAEFHPEAVQFDQPPRVALNRVALSWVARTLDLSEFLLAR